MTDKINPILCYQKLFTGRYELRKRTIVKRFTVTFLKHSGNYANNCQISSELYAKIIKMSKCLLSYSRNEVGRFWYVVHIGLGTDFSDRVEQSVVCVCLCVDDNFPTK